MKRLANAAGLLIGLLGVAFVVRELASNWTEVVELTSDAALGWLVVAFLSGLTAMTTIGIVWWAILRVLGHRRAPLDALRRYFVGQLGKYVPGGIWPVVGRAEMARRGGVPGATAYGSTMLSLALTYLAAVLLAGLALVSGAGGGDGVAWQPVLLLLPVGLIVLHPRLLGFGLGLLRRVTGRELAVPVPPWRTSAALLLAHLPAWLAISAATWLVAYALSGQAPDLRNIVFATTLAWVVGFIAVPVPGGIGVREAVFVAAATSLPSAGLAAAVSVVARVLFILVDLTGAGSTSLFARSGSSHERATAGGAPEPDAG